MGKSAYARHFHGRGHNKYSNALVGDYPTVNVPFSRQVQARIGGRPISSLEVLVLCSFYAGLGGSDLRRVFSLHAGGGTTDGAGGGGCGTLISQKSNLYPSPVILPLCRSASREFVFT
jgi:hypothetical protein